MKKATLFFVSCILWGGGAFADVKRVVLRTPALAAEFTTDLGGRVISLSLTGQDNFLLTADSLYQQSDSEINESGGYHPFFGHEVWFGPQSQWWVDQDLSAKRRVQKTVWPPDPFTVLSSNQLVMHTDKKIVMQSVKSPVTGLAVEKVISQENVGLCSNIQVMNPFKPSEFF